MADTPSVLQLNPGAKISARSCGLPILALRALAGVHVRGRDTTNRSCPPCSMLGSAQGYMIDETCMRKEMTIKQVNVGSTRISRGQSHLMSVINRRLRFVFRKPFYFAGS